MFMGENNSKSDNSCELDNTRMLRSRALLS